MFYAPTLPRTQLPFRTDRPGPHDTPAITLHSSRLALQLRVRNKRFHDTNPWLSYRSLNHDNRPMAIPPPVALHSSPTSAKASGAPRPQLPEERPGRRLPPLLASSPESPYRRHTARDAMPLHFTTLRGTVPRKRSTQPPPHVRFQGMSPRR